MVFQIGLVIFATLASFKVWKQYQRKQVSKYWWLVLSAFWVLVAVVAITPQTTDILAKQVGVGRGADLLVYLAVVLLFYLVYRLLVEQQKLSAEITELVRQAAIDKATLPQADLKHE
ncbi:MAG: DUF2304 family protein [Patescibacteria group bacterium]